MPVRALFVDDEPAIRSLFRTILEMQGYRVECAESAARACDALAQRRFDLVITDMHMETSLSGRKVIQTAQGLQPRPVIVILTAYVLTDDEWRDTGADDLLVKGTDVLTMTSRLKALLAEKAHAAAS